MANKNTVKMPKIYKGKSTDIGGGGRFQMMKDALMKKGMSASSAEAITANAGRKKYGKKKFQKMARIGKKRNKKEINRG